MKLMRRSEALVATGTSTAIKWLSPLARRTKLLHQDLHPEMRVMVGLSTLSGNRSLMSDSIPLARKKMAIGARLITGKPTPVASVQNLQINGAEGPIAARHYVANPNASQRPLLIFFHGGGFCLGDLNTHDEACRHLCAKGGYDVLSVAYRLAPEHPFPAGINDSVAAIRWARSHCDQLGIDPNRIAVGGDSAGGTMSAAASLIRTQYDAADGVHDLARVKSAAKIGTGFSGGMHHAFEILAISIVILAEFNNYFRHKRVG